MTVRLPLFSTMTFPHLERLATTIGLVLASGSPRRKTILTELGIPFDIVVSDIEEPFNGDAPAQQAMGLAEAKARSVPHDGRRVYLGCDTIVVLDGRLLTKPVDEADALGILTALSGRTHSVFTGLALYDSKNDVCLTDVEESRVTFNAWDETRLLEYIATGEPMDKAGAYGIQGMGRFLVDTVEGNIDNVIGLPLGTLDKLIERYMKAYV